jgi:hypothetical protein
MHWTLQYKVCPSLSEGFALCIRPVRRRSGLQYRTWFQVGRVRSLLPWNELEKLEHKELDPRRAESIVDTLKKVNACAVPPFALGLDGVSSELVISMGLNALSLEWWGELPDEWVSLREVVRELDEIAEEARNA